MSYVLSSQFLTLSPGYKPHCRSTSVIDFLLKLQLQHVPANERNGIVVSTTKTRGAIYCSKNILENKYAVKSLFFALRKMT